MSKVADLSTEKKIKEAARTIFHKKGFAATRTRDIAACAGINLALLNYYFRSKEKLFALIMMESFHEFIQSIKNLFNSETTSLEHKIETLVSNYIELLIDQPDMPLFLLSELRYNPQELIAKVNVREILIQSHFLKQFKKEVNDGKIAPIDPLHFIMNLLSMTIFPFVASPLLKSLGDLSPENFNALMLQRKVLIPQWINAILRVK